MTGTREMFLAMFAAMVCFGLLRFAVTFAVNTYAIHRMAKLKPPRVRYDTREDDAYAQQPRPLVPLLQCEEFGCGRPATILETPEGKPSRLRCDNCKGGQ